MVLIESIKKAVRKFNSLNGSIKIYTHYDTDGITSGAIICKALQRKDRKWSLQIVKQLNQKTIKEISESSHDIIFFLDLSGDFESIKKIKKNVFILDHHEFNDSSIPENICLVNPFVEDGKEELSASCVCYLFAKEMDEKNIDLANLAVLGIIGDMLDKSIGRISNSIIKDAQAVVRKSLLILPSTRPLNKALEFSSIYIPGVTGSPIGALNLLREAGIRLKENEKFKTVLDLSDEELRRLITLITLKKVDFSRLIGNVYLIKFFNKLEDTRELSTIINACGRLNQGDIAISYCLGNKKVENLIREIYSSYKHNIISGLNWISLNEKIEGDGYVIINGKNVIKDTIIGTLASILSLSFVYPEGTVIAGMAYTDSNTIKVSVRITGKNEDINLKKIIESIANAVGGESGGHKDAAGCVIPLSQESVFINLLQKELSMQQIKIKVQ